MIFFRGSQAAAAQKMMRIKKTSAWRNVLRTALDSSRERAWRVAYGENYKEKQRTCLAARTKILKMDFRGPSISSIMIYAGFGDLLLKGAANLIWAWKKKFKEGAKELSRTLVGLDNKENMEAIRAMRIEMATVHTMVEEINRKVDLLLAGPTRPVRPTLPLAPSPPLSPKENGEAVSKVNGGSGSKVNGESDGEVNGGNGGGE